MEYDPQRQAEWDLYSLAGADMPVGYDEVEEAMDGYRNQILTDVLFAEMIEQHRPVIRRDSWSYRPDYYNVQCAACNGNVWSIVKVPDDAIPECKFWTNAKSLGLVADTSPASQEDEDDTTYWLKR